MISFKTLIFWPKVLVGLVYIRGEYLGFENQLLQGPIGRLGGSKDYLVFSSLFLLVFPLYWLAYLIITPLSFSVLLFRLF